MKPMRKRQLKGSFALSLLFVVPVLMALVGVEIVDRLLVMEVNGRELLFGLIFIYGLAKATIAVKQNGSLKDVLDMVKGIPDEADA